MRCLLLSLVVVALTAADGVTVSGLRCEHLIDPIGIHAARPRLTWVLAADARGQRQTAYQIQVASTRAKLDAGTADIWDSGTVASEQSVLVPYGGAALASRARAWWRVKAWDKDGAASAWSAPAFWEMGLVHPADWSARWIGLDQAPPATAMSGAHWIWFDHPEHNALTGAPAATINVRKTFTIVAGKALEQALLRVSVDDGYVLRVNGAPVAVDASGGWKSVQEVDLTALVKPGDNVVAIAARNDGGPAGLVAKIILRHAGDAAIELPSDATWRATDQAVVGWEATAFADAAWKPARVLAPFGQGPWATSAPNSPPPYLRREIRIDKPVDQARLYITALGLYQARINGERVGDIALASEWTDYRKRVRYQVYDVTAALKQGDNALGVNLGDGWYCGAVGLTGNRVYGQQPALLYQLEITHADGSLRTVVSDGDWRGSPGPIQQSDMLHGEIYDARLAIDGWDRTGFAADAWRAATVREEAPRALDPQVAPPVRRTQEIPAVALAEPKPGMWTFDLGQNMVGFIRLRASAPAGTRLTMRFAEMLNPDGTVYMTNMRGARHTDDYICSGAGVESWEPSFTFHGFRYVEIAGLTAKPALDAVTGVVLGSDTRRIGTWECSDERLDRLYANILWGQRGNYLSVPTDCPQRDERCGWMGDAQVFVKTAAYSMDVAPFFAKWLVDVDDAQTAEGAYPDIAPRVACGDGTPAWAEAGVICPWTVYRMTGDERILADHFPAMVKSIAYIRDKQCDKLIRVRRGSDYGDWLSIGADTDKEVIGTAYFAYATDLVARIALILGDAEAAAAHRALFDDIRAAFNAKYVTPDGRIHNDTQCAYLMALRFGLVEGKAADSAAARLVADIRGRDIRLSTGFVGVSYLLPVLSSRGEDDLAWKLMQQDAFPSWLFSVKHGATTIWERWDGWTPEKGFQDAGMNSFNHYSLGSCGEWMYETAAGIGLDPATPGFKRMVIRPRPGGTLTRVAATHESPYGRIVSGWAKAGGETTYDIAIPVNTTAEIHLAAAKADAVREGDAPAAKAPGVTFVRQDGGDAVFAVGSGTYRFVVR